MGISKKTSSSKAPGRQKGRDAVTRRPGRFLLLAVLAALVLVSLVATVYFVFLRSTPLEQKPENAFSLDSSSKNPPRPADIVPVVSTPMRKEEAKPQIAIVIDDMGYRKETGDALLNLNLNLSFSFLPHAPQTSVQTRRAHDLGRDILLHLPLEPSDTTWDLGPGGLYLSMGSEELQRVFAENLSLVPLAVGINNHMGSSFTENEAAMRVVLECIRKQGLFFLDSLTTARSEGYVLARSMGIKTLQRQIFLDNEHEGKKVVSQIEELIEIAEKTGWAIGLAHPYPSTLAALQTQMAYIERKAEVVGVSKLMAQFGGNAQE